MTRDQIIQILRENEAVEVEFIKANGSLRKMKATRNRKVLEQILGAVTGEDAKEEIDARHNNVTVFDLEKNDFRSFNVLRLKKINVIK